MKKAFFECFHLFRCALLCCFPSNTPDFQMHDWDDYANVFTSILTGSLFEDLDQFTDDELRPFLPLLIASSFGSSSSPQYVSVSYHFYKF